MTLKDEESCAVKFDRVLRPVIRAHQLRPRGLLAACFTILDAETGKSAQTAKAINFHGRFGVVERRPLPEQFPSSEPVQSC